MKIFNGQFESINKFKQADISADWFREHVDSVDWSHQKYMLKHKDLPQDVHLKFVNNSMWYKRLVAMLSNRFWRDYVYKAIEDKNRHVKIAAIDRLLRDGNFKDFDFALSLVNKSDDYIRNYYCKTYLGELLIEFLSTFRTKITQ